MKIRAITAHLGSRSADDSGAPAAGLGNSPRFALLCGSDV